MSTGRRGERTEKQLVQLGVEVERNLALVDEVLEREPDVDRDHRGGEVLGRRRRLLTGGLVLPAEKLGNPRAVPPPELCGDLPEGGVAPRVREQLEPEPEQPAALAVALDLRELLAGLAQRRRPLPVRHLRIPNVDPLLEELREQLLLRAEVRIEGPTRVASGLGDALDARADEAPLDENPRARIEERGPRRRLALSPCHSLGGGSHIQLRIWIQ